MLYEGPHLEELWQLDGSLLVKIHLGEDVTGDLVVDLLVAKPADRSIKT